MPTPTIPAGNLFMNATTYTGTGTTGLTINNGVAGQAFQPDLSWIKLRSTSGWHQLQDSVRGSGYVMYSNATDAEANKVGTSQIQFNSNGVTLIGSSPANGDINTSGATFVNWQWKAGGTAVSNTAGSITSQVSANTTSGFSVVTYTGTGSTASIGHGLGATPTFIIVKCRANTNSWRVYVSGVTGNADSLILNSTAALQTGNPNALWSTSNMTSTTFGVGVNTDTNQSSQTFVAYCWAPIAGYSAFGSYTGNGSADGPFIYTGFRPRWIMIKVTNTTNAWVMYDTSRGPYNTENLVLLANDAGAEGSSSNTLDILSNGFKLRGAAQGATNASGNTYIYAAFAENPFKYANAF